MKYRERLHRVIPGGAHTYSRGDDQFPENAPSILSHGKGAYVYTNDGHKLLDYGMGLRSVNIGYGNEEVANAAYAEILKGNNLTRASITELTAAELLVDLIPSVDMVKFAKHGSTVTTAAIKLARAYTGKKYVAIPSEHPFFSFDDWFIGTTPMNRGVLTESSEYTLKFNYNDIKSLENLFAAYPNQIACVFLEPVTNSSPCINECLSLNHSCSVCDNKTNNFLHKVKMLAHKNDSLFVLDEMITGFRWDLRGAQSYFDIEPDLCTFGKAMANGFAVAALAGRREIMNIGNILEEGLERVFLTSTTHGAEMSSLGAFIKTIEILKRENVIEHFWKYGNRLIDEVKFITNRLGIQEYFSIDGFACSPNYITKDLEKQPSLGLRTLFAQEMINNNVLFPYIALSNSHQDEEFSHTIYAIEKSLNIYANALSEKNVDKYLKSRIIKPVFRKFN
jgi:glutamate-1-semialdehyde 2,1-aminomutase